MSEAEMEPLGMVQTVEEAHRMSLQRPSEVPASQREIEECIAKAKAALDEFFPVK